MAGGLLVGARPVRPAQDAPAVHLVLAGLQRGVHQAHPHVRSGAGPVRLDDVDVLPGLEHCQPGAEIVAHAGGGVVVGGAGVQLVVLVSPGLVSLLPHRLRHVAAGRVCRGSFGVCANLKK